MNERYRELTTLARGGMGEVVFGLRREGDYKRLYAIKRIAPEHVRSDSVREMFLREARLGGLVRHHNVVPVLDVGEDESGPYLVMDLVEGVPLSKLISVRARLGGVLPIGVCLEVAEQSALGLDAIHRAVDFDGEHLGLVHRDISPQNVLVGFDGVVRITDFGIAKAVGETTQTTTGIIKGKLGYMPPELLRFETPDERSDLYSLGVVLYEMLAGRRLYRVRGDSFATARRILTEDPPDLSDDRDEAPPALCDMLFALLAKDPAARPSSAQEVVSMIQAIREELEEPSALLELVSDELEEERTAFRTKMDAARAHATQPEEPRTPMVAAKAKSTQPSRARAFGLLAAALVVGAAGIAVGVTLGAPDDDVVERTPTRSDGTTTGDFVPAPVVVPVLGDEGAENQPEAESPTESEIEDEAQAERPREPARTMRRRPRMRGMLAMAEGETMERPTMLVEGMSWTFGEGTVD